MNKEQLLELLRTTIHEITDIDLEEITSSSAVIDDLDMNSLEILTMISGLEKRFQMKFQTKDLRSIVTVEDIADYIVSKQVV